MATELVSTVGVSDQIASTMGVDVIYVKYGVMILLILIMLKLAEKIR